MRRSTTRQKALRFLAFFGLAYLFFVVIYEFPSVFRLNSAGIRVSGDPLSRRTILGSREEIDTKYAPTRPFIYPFRAPEISPSENSKLSPIFSGLNFDNFNASLGGGVFSELDKSARKAWEVGKKLFDELQGGIVSFRNFTEEEFENCPTSVVMRGEEFTVKKGVMEIPCGLTLGSHITVVGKPGIARSESDPKIVVLSEGEGSVMVSQFMMELRGIKSVDGEDPPRILHFNPRLKGDWSRRPVIEMNTCYRMQWGAAQRCEGWKSRAEEETGMRLELV